MQMSARNPIFSAQGWAGWQRPGSQILLGILVAAVAVPLIYRDYTLAVLLGILPFVPLIIRNAVWVVVIFLGFAFFNVHEAYPDVFNEINDLLPVNLTLLTGAMSIAALLVLAVLRTQRVPRARQRFMIPALVATGATIGIGILSGVLTGSSGTAVRIAAMLNAVAASLAMIYWYRWLCDLTDAPWGNEIYYFAAFFILVTISVATSFSVETAALGWNSIFWKIAAISMVLAWLPNREVHFSGAMLAFVIFGTLIAFVAIYNRLNGIDLVEGTRVTIGRTLYSTPEDIANAVPGMPIKGGSKLGDPNDLALVLLFPFALAVAFVWKLRLTHINGIICALCLPFITFGILFTQSRGGALGVLAVLGIIGLREIKSKIVLVALGLAAVGLLVIGMDLQNRASGGAAELAARGIDESANERFYTWTAAVLMAVARPLTGVGMWNYPDLYFQYTPHWSGIPRAVHSTWFGVLAEAGFLGLGIFLSMIWAAWASISKTLKRLVHYAEQTGRDTRMLEAIALGLSAGLLSFCASGTFLTQGFTFPVYILVALVASFSRYVLAVQIRAEGAAPGQTATTAPAQPR